MFEFAMQLIQGVGILVSVLLIAALFQLIHIFLKEDSNDHN